MLKKTARDGSIQRVAAVKAGPKVSHMFFAHDSLIFCRAKEKDCRKILEILEVNEQASRQVINMEKSSILFSTNTSAADRELVMNSLDIHRYMVRDKYLRLPILIGRNRRVEFRSIRERIWS